MESTSPTEITCRVDDLTSAARDDWEEATMVVFLKVSEEAACEWDTVCLYTYTATLPTVEAMEASFEPTSEAWQIRVSGSGFTGDSDTV